MTELEKLDEAIAYDLCDAQTGAGSWICANETEMNHWRYMAKSARLAAISHLAATGWQVKRAEPTREMWVAGADYYVNRAKRHHDVVLQGIMDAMDAAAPKFGGHDAG